MLLCLLAYSRVMAIICMLKVLIIVISCIVVFLLIGVVYGPFFSQLCHREIAFIELGRGPLQRKVFHVFITAESIPLGITTLIFLLFQYNQVIVAVIISE